MGDFFVTLVSNSSMDLFTQNTTSSFTVQLPEKITLNGSWCVAVAEIHYNYNFFNVSDGNNRIILMDKANDQSKNEINRGSDIESHNITIPNGFYTSLCDLVHTVNESLQPYVKGREKLFSINKTSGRTMVNKEILVSDIENIFLEGRLGMQLGFKPMCDTLMHALSPHVGNTFFGIPDQMFIYTDIIEPTFIGHEKIYVLKIINTEAKNLTFGDACYKEFTHMHYIRIQKREFDSITVNIRDSTGKFMPFQHGVLTIKLHFMKRNE